MFANINEHINERISKFIDSPTGKFLSTPLAGKIVACFCLIVLLLHAITLGFWLSRGDETAVAFSTSIVMLLLICLIGWLFSMFNLLQSRSDLIKSQDKLIKSQQDLLATNKNLIDSQNKLIANYKANLKTALQTNERSNSNE